MAPAVKLGRMQNSASAPSGHTTSGSGTSSPKQAYECTRSGTCAANETCRNNACVDVCSASPCSGGKFCIPGTAHNYQCVECTGDDQCAEGNQCRSNKCMPCAQGETCRCPANQMADGNGACKGRYKYHCEGSTFVADKDFSTLNGTIKAGNRGGTGCENTYSRLSQEGNSWVFAGASVSGNAKVMDNSVVYGSGRVYGNAKVMGNSKVMGDATNGSGEVYDYATLDSAVVLQGGKVYGNARVSNDSWVQLGGRVYGNARVDGTRVTRQARVCGNVSVNASQKYILSGCDPAYCSECPECTSDADCANDRFCCTSSSSWCGSGYQKCLPVCTDDMHTNSNSVRSTCSSSARCKVTSAHVGNCKFI